MSSWYAKVAGSISGQGIYKDKSYSIVHPIYVCSHTGKKKVKKYINQPHTHKTTKTLIHPKSKLLFSIQPNVKDISKSVMLHLEGKKKLALIIDTWIFLIFASDLEFS